MTLSDLLFLGLAAELTCCSRGANKPKERKNNHVYDAKIVGNCLTKPKRLLPALCFPHFLCLPPQMQYSFIYQALLEYYLYGDTELDVCSLEGHLQRLHNTRAPHDRLGLEEEFRVGRKTLALKHFSQ